MSMRIDSLMTMTTMTMVLLDKEGLDSRRDRSWNHR